MKTIVLLGILALSCHAQDRRFPADFVFGTATASYQIEGGWNADDKGENIWDYMTHNRPNVITDVSNGDIACDSYHNYKRDVEMMRELGLDAFRMSLSWTRIMPNGFPSHISEAGIAFYNNFIDEMLKYNIKPMVTLFHWDLPQKLQELGGFMNPLIADWYEDYARVVFDNFGDRVKLWITFNEPREICYEAYGSTTKAPQLNATGIGEYLCNKHLLMAHAKAYHVYAKEFKAKQGGDCGITISINSYEPLTDTPEDILATEIRKQAEWGMYTEPIYSEQGGYPKEMSERIAEKSKQQGYSRSRLPELTEEEKAFIRGSADFLGVNHYTSLLASATEYIGNPAVPSMYDDAGVGAGWNPEWPAAESYWLKQAPNSIYNALTDLKARYNNPIIYITENGWSTNSTYGSVDDDRIRYYRAALESVLDTLEAGVNLKGYMAWSLMDNFEWMSGYTERFGIYAVDFEDPARPRTPKKSAYVYKRIIRDRAIDHSYNPDITMMTMTIDEGH